MTGLGDLPPPPPETWSQRLAYWRYRAVWEAAARLPPAVAARVPDRIGAAWYHAASATQRRQVRRNLSRVLGGPPADELEATVVAAYAAYARYWLDSFRLHVMSPADVVARSTVEDLDRVDDLLADGDGAILATAHLGSWDIGALFAAERGWGMAVVAEVVEPRRLFDRFVDLRREAGIGVIPLIDGGQVVPKLEAVIRDGGLATLLADRDLGRKGPIVNFFGDPCRLPAGPAVLARRTGLPVAVGAFLTRGDGYHAVIHSVVDVAGRSVEDGTQVIATELEGLIARAPAQWHVFVRNWLADREPEHPAVTGAAS